jgi:hypothetical protein
MCLVSAAAASDAATAFSRNEAMPEWPRFRRSLPRHSRHEVLPRRRRWEGSQDGPGKKALGRGGRLQGRPAICEATTVSGEATTMVHIPTSRATSPVPLSPPLQATSSAHPSSLVNARSGAYGLPYFSSPSPHLFIFPISSRFYIPFPIHV